MPVQKFATMAETAELLRCDRRTLRRHIRSGEVPSVVVGRKTLVPAVWFAEIEAAAMAATTDRIQLTKG